MRGKSFAKWAWQRPSKQLVINSEESRKFQQAVEGKAQCMDEESPRCNGESAGEEGKPTARCAHATISGTVSLGCSRWHGKTL